MDEYFVVHDTFNKFSFHSVSTELQMITRATSEAMSFSTVIYTIATVVVQRLMKFPFHRKTISD